MSLFIKVHFERKIVMKKAIISKTVATKMTAVILLGAMLLSFSACAVKEALPLNDIVKNTLSENDIDKSKIVFLYDSNENDFVDVYSDVSSKISDEELKKYVDDLLLSHEKMIEVTDRNTVQNGDAIVVSYVVRYNSEIVANVDSEPLMVGSGNYGEEFEKAVIGAVVGEPFECELSSPIDTEKYKKGDILQYNITVESINYFEAYTSSDQYILDYYGVETEEEFLAECEVRLRKIKVQENKYSTDNEFLDKVAEKCAFYINKQEVAKYSEKVVEQHKNLAYISGLDLEEYITQTLKISEDDFYEQCYNDGVQQIKQYLLVGAYQKDVTFDNNKDFALFCSMNGYDSTADDNTQAKYDYLKSNTVLDFRNFVSALGLYNINYNNKTQYTIDIYDSSNIYTIDFSKAPSYTVDLETQQAILSCVAHAGFGGTMYGNGNHMYQTVLIVKGDGKIFAKVMVDEINGFVKWQKNDGQIVCAELKENLRELIKRAKQG